MINNEFWFIRTVHILLHYSILAITFSLNRSFWSNLSLDLFVFLISYRQWCWFRRTTNESVTYTHIYTIKWKRKKIRPVSLSSSLYSLWAWSNYSASLSHWFMQYQQLIRKNLDFLSGYISFCNCNDLLPVEIYMSYGNRALTHPSIHNFYQNYRFSPSEKKL